MNVFYLFHVCDGINATIYYICVLIFQINLLDMKRSMNVNIFLKQFKADSDKIIQWITEANEEHMTSERLKGLIKILPEPDEVNKNSILL